jgi:hypothetical protein
LEVLNGDQLAERGRAHEADTRQKEKVSLQVVVVDLTASHQPKKQQRTAHVIAPGAAEADAAIDAPFKEADAKEICANRGRLND